MNPLKSVNGAIITSLLLMAALGFALGGSGFSVQNLDRWLHIASGVTWIGLLYYFNVVQVPALAAAAAAKVPAFSANQMNSATSSKPTTIGMRRGVRSGVNTNQARPKISAENANRPSRISIV